jgi:hypothetical protein
MIRLRPAKLIAVILYVLFGFSFAIYFMIVGGAGVFVISQIIVGKICENYGEVSDTVFFVINVVTASLLGILPFGLVASECISVWFKKWNIPTIQDILKK